MPSTTPWASIEVKIPGQELLEKVQEFCETLVVFLDIAKTILNLIKTFLVGIGNPIQALVMAVLALVNNLIESLRQTGLYWWFNLPDFAEDPSCKRLSGGYPAFVQRWKGSLLDAQDINRPKPLAGFSTGFFLMLVVDVNNLGKLITGCQALMKFFGGGREEPTTHPSPSGVKLFPVDKRRIPIAFTKLFGAEPDAIAVQWTLPSNTKIPDPSLGGAAAVLTPESGPPNWLVERSTVYPGDRTEDFSKPGLLIHTVNSGAKNPRTTEPYLDKVEVFDVYGQPVILMEEVFVVTAPQWNQVFNDGFLGRYTFYDKTNIKKDTTYYYRVRGFSGKLTVSDNKIPISASDIKLNGTTGKYELTYPGENVVMGKATTLLPIRIPSPPTNFDVQEHFYRIFLAAFSLGFALSLNPKKKLGSDGRPILNADGYPEYERMFTDAGDPIPQTTTNKDIGKMTISKIAGALASYTPDPTTSVVEDTADNTQWGLKAPWTTWDFRVQATKQADAYTNLAISAGASFVEGFKTLMQNVPPYGAPETADLRTGASTISNANTLGELVFKLTDATPVNTIKVGGTEINTSWTTTPNAVRTFGLAYADKNVRKNVLAAVNYVLALGYQGQPPDWGRIAILDDLVPWSSSMIYEILRVVQSLVDSFNDLLKEIVAFIDMIVRKITVLEEFIEYLIVIIDFIKSFNVGVYFLAAWDLTGGVSSWFSALESAGGNKPQSTGVGSYTGGICLAGVGTNLGGLQEALKKIFGG